MWAGDFVGIFVPARGDTATPVPEPLVPDSERPPPDAFPWGEHLLPTEGATHVRVGPLDVWIRRAGEEVLLTHAESGAAERLFPEEAGSPGSEADADVPGADTVWSRWAVDGEPRALRFEPAFPDRPLVAQPEASFRLVQGAGARIYIRVPLHVRIRLPGDDGAVLAEVPTVTLSNTWFGDFTDGELCYWLPTTARRSLSGGLFAPHLAACPVQLVNRSGEVLEVAKLSLRVGYLTVFDDGGRLWSDETRVRYVAEEAGSRLEVGGKPPREAPEARRAGAPRDPFPVGLTAKTFHRLRTLSPFGIPG